MKWEKIGVTVVSGPKAYGSGVYLRIPKSVAKAYELYSAETIEFEIRRVKRPPAAEKTEA